jgi:hypothetical protein
VLVDHGRHVPRIMGEDDAVGRHVLCPAAGARRASRLFVVVIVFLQARRTAWEIRNDSNNRNL